MTERTTLGAGIEFDLIRRFLADAQAEDGDTHSPHVLVAAGDDCAIIDGGTLAISADLSIENVHFRRDWLEPEEIGYRAAAAALSDLAAVAAEPLAILVSLAVPVALATDIAPAIVRGARAAARSVGASLIGGDLTRAHGAIAIDVVVLGRVVKAVLRSGAVPGDELWVTGELGAAAAAVAAWRNGASPDPAARRAYALPAPRTAEAVWLRERGALHAAIDLSDGLAGDAGHLAAASGIAIEIDETRVPIHPTALAAEARGSDALRLALTGGEDYELLFAAPAGTVDTLADEFARTFRVRLTRIGTVSSGSGMRLLRHDGSTAPLDARAFDHFREDGP